MKKKMVFSIACMAAMCATPLRCGHVDTVSVTKTEFVPGGGSNPKYHQSKRYFLLYPGDTALLYGTAACTLIVNGVVTSAAADSIYFRSITGREKRLTVGDTVHAVSPQRCQAAARFHSLAHDSGITFHYKRTQSGVLLMATEENGILTPIPKGRRTVIPNPLDMGSYGKATSPLNNWTTPPLFPLLLSDLKEIPVFEARSVASAAMALDANSTPYRVRDCFYSDGVELVTYHSLSGNLLKAGMEAAVIGTVVITSHYFKDIGLVDQYQRWNIQTNYRKGHTEIEKKNIWIGRGPDGAKTYPDYDTLGTEGGKPPISTSDIQPNRDR